MFQKIFIVVSVNVVGICYKGYPDSYAVILKRNLPEWSLICSNIKMSPGRTAPPSSTLLMTSHIYLITSSTNNNNSYYWSPKLHWLARKDANSRKTCAILKKL